MCKHECWACWQPATKSDPLIRACLKCKDPSLQYIHSNCINKFITIQLLASNPLGAVEEHVPFISQTTLNEINKLGNKQFKCARCLDAYVVRIVAVSPIRALLTDVTLSVLMLMMTVFVSVLGLACISIISSSNTNTMVDLYFAAPMNVKTWTLGMLVIFSGIYLATIAVVVSHFSGYRNVQVETKQ